MVLGNLGQLVTLLAVDQTLSSLTCLQLGSHSWNPRVTGRNPPTSTNPHHSLFPLRPTRCQTDQPLFVF